MIKPDELVFTRIVFLLPLEKVNTRWNSVKLLAIYSLVNLRRNWFYLSPKLLFNPIQVKPILIGDQIHSQAKMAKSPDLPTLWRYVSAVLGKSKLITTLTA